MIAGQPVFNFDLDSVNPIGSIILGINYMFYDLRLTKLAKQANFEFITKFLVKLADRAYHIFKRPLHHYMSYLKIHEEEIQQLVD